MLSDTLALARGEPLRKIGEYQWCEPDYRQILIWAEALELEPEEVIRRLLDRRILTWFEIGTGASKKWTEFDPQECGGDAVFRDGKETVFRNGKIVGLNWDLDLLPLGAFSWVDGLEIEYLRFRRRTCECRIPHLDLALPKLRSLLCCSLEIEELDLSEVPALEWLFCSENRLTNIDLSHLPLLTSLFCSENHIQNLNLSNVPNLEDLDCAFNRLAILDLSSVPKLTYLSCGNNQLSELDLSRVSTLSYLECENNQLRKLDLRSVPELTDLVCMENQLTSLDLSCVPNLARLHCDNNQIEWLDIRPLGEKVPIANWYFSFEPAKLIQRPDQHFK